jgi:hypothetical protein
MSFSIHHVQENVFTERLWKSVKYEVCLFEGVRLNCNGKKGAYEVIG